MLEDRITELEIRLTHIEDTLDVLNQTVIDQHNLIDQLQLRISILEKKLKAAAASNIAPESEETPPPHY
jgi:SlyX protein